MSTAVPDNTLLNLPDASRRSDNGQSNRSHAPRRASRSARNSATSSVFFASRTSSSSSSSEDEEEIGSLQKEVKAHPPLRIRKRTIRRMAGVLLGETGENALVLLVSGDREVRYRFPMKELSDAGITMVNQPFELDEVEIYLGEKPYVSHEFRPLATEAAAYLDQVSTTDQMSEDEKLIELTFGKSGH